MSERFQPKIISETGSDFPTPEQKAREFEDLAIEMAKQNGRTAEITVDALGKTEITLGRELSQSDPVLVRKRELPSKMKPSQDQLKAFEIMRHLRVPIEAASVIADRDEPKIQQIVERPYAQHRNPHGFVRKQN